MERPHASCRPCKISPRQARLTTCVQVGHQVGIAYPHASHTRSVGKRCHLQEANISLLLPHPSRIKQKLGHGHVLAIYHLQDGLTWAVGSRGRVPACELHDGQILMWASPQRQEDAIYAKSGLNLGGISCSI